MNATKELTIEDLQRTAIQVWDGELKASVYRLGDFDSSPALLRRQTEDGDVYYSQLVLCSYPSTMSVN
jgi:hypothetical protein